MKKVFLGILSTAIVLSMCSAAAFAAGPGCGRHFVDAGGDGVCDNAGNRCAYADADGDGFCDVCGAEHGTCLIGAGAAFADADGDGICDNCGTYHRCGGNFVDSDGDGICDNYHSGRGHGCRSGRCR